MSRLSDSFLLPPEGERLGELDEDRPVRLTVVLRPATSLNPGAYSGGKTLTREDYAARYGTPQAVLDEVAAFARQHGLNVVEASGDKHIVRLQGTCGQARAAFQPEELGMYRVDGKPVAARSGHLFVPGTLADQIVAVLGFDERPIVNSHFRLLPEAQAATDAWDPAEVARRYQFPVGVDGSGQAIALIELGGGYDPADVARYFANQGIRRTGRLVAVGVDGAENVPGRAPGGADAEVQLDIDIAGSVARGADIVVYFGVNRITGLLDVIQAAIDDRGHNPAVISVSWGAPEARFSRQAMLALDQMLQSAATLGITVCVASGDAGAQDGLADGALHVNFPASSPHALGCGGTRLPRRGPEVAWNDGPRGGGASGGGFSALFPQPGWQVGVEASMRGVPDVAGNADPVTGYHVRVNGMPVVTGGTSAVAPLWAGLIVLMNQTLGRRVGFLNPIAYAHPAVFTDITRGNNDGYVAAPGWDPVTGLGSPVGTSLLTVLRDTGATDKSGEA